MNHKPLLCRDGYLKRHSVAISRPIAILINAEAPNFGFQGCSRDLELRGGTVRARDPAMSLGQCGFNDLLLVIR